jgi:phosphoribosylformimino-5-aminoimidazole carboxamide ribotide isomerase
MVVNMFEIYPAIDLRHGKVVRLQEGDPQRQTVFADNPVVVAERWASLGARWLHVVNLDGALDESPTDSPQLLALLRKLCAVGLRVQFGGGIRSLEVVQAVLSTGVFRAILGTVAVKSPELLTAALASFGPQRIAVGIDTREGRVRLHGWQEDGGLEAADLGRRMKALGVETVIHTDIARDGLLTGVNAQASGELAQSCGLRVIASGGVATVEDVRRARAASPQGVEGVIIGRALYQGTVDLREALAIAQEQAC